MSVIGIIGRGKMGQAIEALLELDPDTQFHVFSRLSEQNLPFLKACNAVIEFTTPEAAPDIIRTCLTAQIPVISGTTGWHEFHLDQIIKLTQDTEGRFLYASNFSVGMNITFALNRRLIAIMNQFKQFIPSIREVHHIHKKDAPSGTALTLIDDIIGFHSAYTGYELNNASDPIDEDKFSVTAIREGEVKGYHEVSWNSGLEKISISHEAFDRKIFAAGAIMAANWLKDQQPGVYTMKDIIRL
ncbi:MAG: 4-hydroxy-tetrahydrodipicolinate reductase [Bacteroidota bacterium]|nr:4-hydroxy-tetrahydrodipicolinate reductase [Bacteroidota bacterium]